ncbi:MAG: hypothetical protein ACM31O_11525 [Bacteroidota bacterium]|jgi:hypothetical protein
MNRVALQRRLGELVQMERAAEYRQWAYERQCALQAEKWALLCDLMRASPFPTRQSLSRSAQWRAAAQHLRETLPPGELIEWALLQADIARNHERGVRDLRPHKDGPCHALIMDYAEMRRDKARAVLRWAEAATASGADVGGRPSRVFTSAEPQRPRRSERLSPE